MKKIKRFVATLISIILCLAISTSCSFEFFWQNRIKLPSDYDIYYSLTQTDVDQIKESYQRAKSLAIENGEQTDMIMSWNEFVVSVNWLVDQVYVALILYYNDYLSEEAKQRYLFTTSAYADAYAYYVDLLKTLYTSNFKDLFFSQVPKCYRYSLYPDD